MPDCTHEKFNHTLYTPTDNDALHFHVIRCAACKQLLNISPIDYQLGILNKILERLTSLNQSMTKTH